MERMSPFLRWSLFATTVAVGGIVAWSLGWLKAVYGDDPTRLVLVNAAVLLLASAWCGRLSWRLSRGTDPFLVRLHLEDAWFASGLCVTVGMIGTAVGFAVMYKQGIPAGDFADAVKGIMSKALIAIMNTLFGGICGALIEIQSHFLGKAVRLRLYALGWVTDDAGKLVRVESEGKGAK